MRRYWLNAVLIKNDPLPFFSADISELLIIFSNLSLVRFFSF